MRKGGKNGNVKEKREGKMVPCPRAQTGIDGNCLRTVKAKLLVRIGKKEEGGEAKEGKIEGAKEEIALKKQEKNDNHP